ncbi:hypothetical protein U8527_14395 [Kordia algicida OT-1]|uniref:hypothetical protein n=1 Tax=Kordia algicida TaxID=221066 RepID=UPI003D9B3A25
MNLRIPLVVSISVFIFSCTKTVTETVVEKEIVYLQKVNDTLLKINLPKENGNLYRFKILRHDTIFSYDENFGIRKYAFDRFDSIYNIQATFKDKHVKIGKHGTYTQKTIVKDITQVDSVGFKTDYILTRLTQRYQDLKVSGRTGN